MNINRETMKFLHIVLIVIYGTGVYAGDAGYPTEFTTEIDWNKAGGVWFVTMTNDPHVWTTTVKCYTLTPFDATSDGVSLHLYIIPKDSDLKAFGEIELAELQEDGSYRLKPFIDNQWLKKETEMLQKIHQPTKETPDEELQWFFNHPVMFSTNYNVLVYEQIRPDGEITVWICTRNPKLNENEIKSLMDLAIKKGIYVENLKPTGCGDVTPLEYFAKE